MTAENKIKREILRRDTENSYGSLDTDESVAAAFEKENDDGALGDLIGEYREGEVETKLECASHRNYESKAVAAKTEDGSWVGWTYWYGGGKHSNPEEIPWMEDAYDLLCTEEEKTVTVRTFAKTA